MSTRPAPGAAPSKGLVSEVVLRAIRAPDGTLTIELAEGGVVQAAATGVELPAGLAMNLDELVHSRVGQSPSAWAEAEWRLLEADLAEYGRRLGDVLFAGEVGQALSARLSGMRTGELLDVVFEAGGDLLLLPIEAARLSQRGDTVLALEPRVRVRRRPASRPATAQGPLPHPLKVLVAVAAPDPEQGGGPELDLERELHTILSAVEHQAELGRVQVRVLETASLAELGRALEQDTYHVVHMSGHGAPGVLILEDEDGAAIPATPDQLVGVLARSGRPVPLLVLSACDTAAPATRNVAAMAGALVAAGMDRVVAMQTQVTDRYAIALAQGLYRRLASQEGATVGAALAQTRQELEQLRRSSGAGAGELWAAEYATATLVATGSDTPVVDHTGDAEPLSAPPVHEVHPLLPQLGADDFIGRRRERRTLLRALRDDERFVAGHGRRPGVVLTGIGGIGKSSLAGQAAIRLVEEGWALAVHRGALRLDAVVAATTDALRQRAARGPVPDADRVQWLHRRAEELLAARSDEAALVPLLHDTLRSQRVLLVLDDFEQNLSEGGEAFADDALAAQFGLLVRGAGRSKLLVTCRHPLPGFRSHLHELPVGPLSTAESRKLVLRLPGILRQPEAERSAALQLLGGHPRVLEMTDALLRQDGGRMPVLEKLTELAGREGIPLDRRREPSAATDEAIRLAERDILLPQLLALLDAAERTLLYQAAPSNLPVEATDLASLTGRQDDPEVLGQCSRLTALSLLMPAGEDALLAHRWLAEALRRSDPEEYRAAANRLARRRLELAKTDPTYNNEIEALRNFMTAEAWDEACRLALGLCKGPFARTQLAVSALAGELLTVLPLSHAAYAAVADLEGQADLSCGFTHKAMRRYSQLLQIHEARVSAEPDRADYQRDLSVSYERLGGLMVAVGRGDEAARLYGKALDIRRRLAEAEPDRADYQRDLSVSYIKLGDLMVAAGRGEEAGRLYGQSLDIARRLAEAEPDRADYQRDLSVSYERLGLLAAERGDEVEARRFMTEKLGIARQLAQRDGTRADLASDVAVSLVNLGRISLDRAPDLRQEALQILEALAAEGRLPPDRASLLEDLRNASGEASTTRRRGRRFGRPRAPKASG